jgi:MOSC domain-containing protein YiiM
MATQDCDDRHLQGPGRGAHQAAPAPARRRRASRSDSTWRMDKAVYVYPSEHYAFWRIELPGLRLPYGSFGENFTTEGLEESTVYIGDQFSIGSAVVEVTQPRMPCYKLGVRFGRLDMPQRFHASGRCGFYLAVVAEGDVGAGDAWELIDRRNNTMSVRDRYRRSFDEAE